MSTPSTFPVNVLVHENGRIFAQRALNPIFSKSRTYAVIQGTGKYANKWLLVHTLAGKAMGEYFGHFESIEKAAQFMNWLDSLTPAPTVSDGVISGRFVRKWNVVCRNKGKPILTKRVLLSYFLTTRG